MTTHITYTTAKRLKEFLGSNAPEPMAFERWGSHAKLPYKPWVEKGSHTEKDFNFIFYPAYQLHDLLSKPFCEEFSEKAGIKIKGETVKAVGVFDHVSYVYFRGNLPAVEKALCKMMDTDKEKTK